MSMVSLGDLAQSLVMRRQNLQIRQDITRLAEEVATGRTSTLSSHLSGDFSLLSDIERGLEVLKGFKTSIAEAGLFTDGMQKVLGQVQDISTDLSTNILSLADSGLPIQSSGLSNTGSDALDQMVTLLNIRIAGRSLFAGDATDRPALASADNIMSEIRMAISGLDSVSDIQLAVAAWFDSPSAGFEETAYLGSSTGLSPYRLDHGVSVDLDLRADSAALRSVLKQIALAAVVTDPTTPISATDRQAMARSSAIELMNAQAGLTGLRADLGFAQARIEEGQVRQASEKTSLELTRNTLLSVDSYESATKLEDAQTRLESLYAVTVRLSRLSLSDFMR